MSAFLWHENWKDKKNMLNDEKLDKAVDGASKVKFILLLVIGMVAMSFQKMEGLGVLFGVSVIVWLTVFIYLTQTVKTKRQFLITGVCFWVGSVIRMIGLTGVIAADALIMAVYSVLFLGALLLCRFVSKKYSSALATLIPPAAWAVMLFVFTALRIPSVMRFDLMFFDCKYIIQSVSMISVIGLNIVTVWISAAFAHGLATRKPIIPSTAVLLTAAMVISGAVQISKQPEPCGSVKIGYSTGAYVGDFIDTETLPYEECVASFNKVFAEAVSQNVDILAFSEETYDIKDICEKDFVETIGKAAKENNIYVVVGFDIEDTDGSEDEAYLNKIVFIGSDGKVISEYSKYNIIPIMEGDYAQGNGIIPTPVVNIKGTPVKIAFAICYDSNFPHYFKQIPDDTQLLILPSWDWDGVSYVHAHLCGNLAVENRVSLLKPTYDGYTIAVDPYGNILDFKSTKDFGYENVQVVEMPIYQKNK